MLRMCKNYPNSRITTQPVLFDLEYLMIAYLISLEVRNNIVNRGLYYIKNKAIQADTQRMYYTS